MTAADKSKRGSGRKKIEIKRIEKSESRQVCFTRRRQGIFKKANELCILCGTEVAIVVYSPAGKPFSYGHTSVDAVLMRFLAGSDPAEPSLAVAEADLCETIKWEITYWGNALEEEMRRREQLEAALRAPWPEAEPFWWGADVESIGIEELRECENVLLQHKFVIAQQCWISDPAATGGGDLAEQPCLISDPTAADEGALAEESCWILDSPAADEGALAEESCWILDSPAADEGALAEQSCWILDSPETGGLALAEQPYLIPDSAAFDGGDLAGQPSCISDPAEADVGALNGQPSWSSDPVAAGGGTLAGQPCWIPDPAETVWEALSGQSCWSPDPAAAGGGDLAGQPCWIPDPAEADGGDLAGQPCWSPYPAAASGGALACDVSGSVVGMEFGAEALWDPIITLW